MRLLITIIGGIIAFVVVAVIALPLFISEDTIRAEVSRQIERTTGYQVAFNGPVGLAGFPATDLSAENVSLIGPPGTALERLTADRMEVGFDLAPLLSGNVVLSNLLFVSPDITIRTGGSRQTPPANQEQTDVGDGQGSWLDQAERIQLDQITVENGTIRLVSQDGSERDRFEAIELQLLMAGISSPLEATIEFRRANNPYGAALSLETVRRLLESEPAAFAATISAPAHLAGELTISTTVSRSSDLVQLANVAVQGTGLDFTGAFEIATTGTPKITGNLAGPLLSTAAFHSSSGQVEPTTSPTEDDGSGAVAAIDLSPLDPIDADVTLSVDRIEAGGYVVAPFVGRIGSEGRTLTAGIDLAGFATGTIAGTIALDGTGDEPFLSGAINADGLDAGEIAQMGGSPFPVTGDAGAAIQFATAGRTLTAWGKRANAAGDVFLSNATISGLGLAGTVNDAAADTLSNIGLVAQFDSLTNPIAINGGAVWRGEQLNLEGSVNGATLAEGGAAPVGINLRSSRANVGYNGTITRTAQLTGAVSADTPSLRGLLAWLGRPLPDGPGLEQFAFSGGLGIEPGAVRFSDATFTLDQSSGSGSGSLTYGGKPTITATLALQGLDLNPYLRDQGGDAGGSVGNSAATDQPWSDEPIDFGPLNALNADLNLSTQSLQFQDISLGPTRLVVALQDGALNANLSEMQLYGGSGTGTLAVTSAETPSIGLDFTMRGLQAEPFLRDVAGFERLTGSAGLTMALNGAGLSQAAIMRSLDGSMRFQFADGVIRGVDLPALVKTLTGQILAGWQVSAGDQTEFNELQASFVITNGQAQTNDLLLNGPLVRVEGTGVVSLPEKALDLSVSPSVKAGLPSTQGQVQLLGLGVPVKVVGPWGAPRIYPDIEGVLTNPQAAFQQLQTFGGGVFELLGNTGETAINLPTQIIEAPVGAVGDVVEQVTGVPVGDAVRSITEGTRDVGGVAGQVLQGVGGLLRGQPIGQQQQAAVNENTADDLTATQPIAPNAAPATDGVSASGVPLPRPRPNTAAGAPTEAATQVVAPEQSAPEQLTPEQPDIVENPEAVIRDVGREMLRGLLGGGN